MTNYTPDEARAALAVVDRRRRQLAAAARPRLLWMMVAFVAWAVTTGLLTDLPRSPANSTIFMVASVLCFGAILVLSLWPRRVKLRANLGVAGWLSMVVLFLSAGVVRHLAYRYIGQLTPLPHTVEAGIGSLYLVAAVMLWNRVFGFGRR